MLAIYSELMDQRLPGLALALSSDAQQRAAAAETAAELAYGAEMMGFDALADHLQAIATRAGTPEDPAQRAAFVAHFSELREQAKIIEDVTGMPSGAGPLAEGLAAQLAKDYSESSRRSPRPSRNLLVTRRGRWCGRRCRGHA